MTIAKRDAKFNALTYGIFAKILMSGEIFGELKEDYLQLLSGLREALRRIDCVEEIQVEKLAFLYLRLTRLYKADVKFAPKLFMKVSKSLDQDHGTVEAKWVSKEDEVLVVRKDPAPDLMMRYESGAERQIDRTLDQIEKLRRMRQGAAKE